MIQQFIDILYRHPMSELKRRARFGGLLSYGQMMANRRSMEKASGRLPAVISRPAGLPVHFLTGKKYLYQTLFCISSLHRFSGDQFRFILVDDGTFDEHMIRQIEKQLPGAAIFLQADIEQRLDLLLPAANYPVLRHKRMVYPHIKKLTDIHTLPGADWKLVLDSDMLFFDDPVELTNWLREPSAPLYMTDCTESYGYSTILMEKLAGARIPSLLNVGAIGLQGSSINWEKLEHWIRVLEEKEGSTYYLEQALSAMLTAGSTAAVLPAEKYIVNPGSQLVSAGSGVLHHYVDLSKKGYYNSAWRQFSNG
ncbi:hypothetical protein ACFFGT_10160 [Mucilaginibacter angelicae]|uniref:Glycosyl transferase n=1 Tax=Mucilaginibacter angelicae TaxID=869718 RepID=A0ABV6L502_9SPHI